MKNNDIFKHLLDDLKKEKEIFDSMDSRSTIMQIVHVESLDKPGTHLLLANTHLFFHPKADFIRLLQSIVCIKYLEKLKHDLGEQLGFKNVSVMFAGDFNSDPASYAIQYIFTHQVPIHDLDERNFTSSSFSILVTFLSNYYI